MFFYLMPLNIYYWEKLTFSKFVGKANFSERKFEDMQELWGAKRYQVYSGKRLFWYYYLQVSFVYKTVSQIFLKFLCPGDKKLLSEFLRKWGRFKDINVFPNILAKNKKTETLFCRWKSADNNDFIIFLSLENHSIFLLAKEKTCKSIFNTDGELSQNRTEKQIMPFIQQ